MKPSDMNRRDFNRLSMAAFGGAIAGAIAGCAPAAAPPAKAPPATPSSSPKAGAPESKEAARGTEKAAPADASTNLSESIAAVGVEKHLCRGLNACKNQGASGENDCAGQGTCATLEHHACGGQNACKGQGGCGKSALANECAGKGGCHVPLMDNVWEKARKIFEAKMKKAGQEVGAAPAKS